jgi:hypothetical protein
MEKNKSSSNSYSCDITIDKYIKLFGFAASISETVRLYNNWARHNILDPQEIELIFAKSYAEGMAKTEIKVALEAFRLAKSVSDFPAVVDAMRSYKLAEDNIEIALKEATAER